MSRTDARRPVPYFPAFLDLLGKRVVVVGGGAVATTKVRSLLPCQPAPLVVVAPEASDFIAAQARQGALEWRQRAFVAEDLDGAWLAFGATDDRQRNAEVAAAARARGIPVLAVDDVPNCDFIAPALVRRGDVTIAISTGGRSPAMARRVREQLERLAPASWGNLLEVAARARLRLGAARSVIDPDAWQQALDGAVEQLAEGGQLEAATDLLLKQLEQSLFAGRTTGLVSLVGAGPGDPELLTVRAVRRLQTADAVVHDRLVSAEVLQLARPGAELISVGKWPGGGADQRQIEALLVRLAQAGQRVVRLKGGDPFVFGRGGEEALALAQAGVPYEVVPGISAALAAPAAAGIPVTHRGLSASVTIATGHPADQHDWAALANGAGTLVFLMPMDHLAELVGRLLAHGRPAREPAAVVQWATTARQRSVVAPLEELSAAVQAAGLGAPAVLVVGPTAALLQAAAAPQRTAAETTSAAALLSSSLVRK